MQRTFTYRLVIYTFAVVMICLRPFLAYEMSSRGDFAKDPNRVFRMLQRLVKKKEFHEDDALEAAELSRSGASQSMLPLIPVLTLLLGALWLRSYLFGANLNWKRNTVFRVDPGNRYFEQISCLQI